jgi:hypothetical protein
VVALARRVGTVLALAVALGIAACTTHSVRQRPVETVSARELHLPLGAQPGMFVTWTIEESEADVHDAVEETIACVGEADGVLTIERRETWRDGSRQVTASRHRRDGSLVGAWRAFEGGIGAPLRVVDTSAERREQIGNADALRRRYGLPSPKVATTQATEWVETPAGRLPCTKQVIEASLLAFRVRFSTWVSVSPLPLSQLVKVEGSGPGYRTSQTLRAYGFEGARPTLTIPAPGP